MNDKIYLMFMELKKYKNKMIEKANPHGGMLRLLVQITLHLIGQCKKLSFPSNL